MTQNDKRGIGSHGLEATPLGLECMGMSEFYGTASRPGSGTCAARTASSAGQVALAWVVSRGDDVIAIPGTKRVERIEENLGALDVELSGDDLAELDACADEVAGGRYAPEGMQSVGR